MQQSTNNCRWTCGKYCEVRREFNVCCHDSGMVVELKQYYYDGGHDDISLDEPEERCRPSTRDNIIIKAIVDMRNACN